MNIAILGSRGIPGNYGGFETCAEELATRLVERGHTVSVYCCKPYSLNKDAYYKGIKRIVLPTIQSKSLEKLIFVMFSLIHVCFTNNNMILMLGVSASAFCFLPRLFGKKIVINVDGLEWQRKKWGRIASKYLLFSERAACTTTNQVVTDAYCIQKYYVNKYRKKTKFIPYGIKEMYIDTTETLSSLSVKPQQYVLYVSRFDPENNALLVRNAFELVSTDKQLIMLGSAPFADKYVEEVKNTQDNRILFPGSIFGNGYRELQTNAMIYIQATEVGGIHPALIEAIGCGHCIIANDVPEHREVLGDAAIYYNGTKEDLASKIQEIINNPALISDYRQRTRVLIPIYSWDRIVSEYESCFHKLINN